MTFSEFKLMDLNSQADATWEYGILMGHREEGKHNMILYRIDDFYSEIHYSQDMNKITGIKCFVSDVLLQPYLDKINLDELLNEI